MDIEFQLILPKGVKIFSFFLKAMRVKKKKQSQREGKDSENTLSDQRKMGKLRDTSD